MSSFSSILQTLHTVLGKGVLGTCENTSSPAKQEWYNKALIILYFPSTLFYVFSGKKERRPLWNQERGAILSKVFGTSNVLGAITICKFIRQYSQYGSHHNSGRYI